MCSRDTEKAKKEGTVGGRKDDVCGLVRAWNEIWLISAFLGWHALTAAEIC